MSEVDFRRLGNWIGVLVLVLVAFVGVKTINEIKEFKYIGSDSFSENNSISVSGEGEVFAVADVASFSYSVVETGNTVGEAEALATEKWNDILEFLKGEGIEEEDIKTINYSIDPQYAPQPPNVTWVPLDQREIVGYTVTQTARVKVRETANTGDILSAVGDMGVRDLSGISFTIDDDEVLRDEARALAIADAREKAETLAESLGVKLDRVIGFYETGDYMPYYGYAEERVAFDSVGGTMNQVSPEIPMGENRIVVNVEVIFRIR